MSSFLNAKEGGTYTHTHTHTHTHNYKHTAQTTMHVKLEPYDLFLAGSEQGEVEVQCISGDYRDMSVVVKVK